jgi:sulfate/thiosulfate transport system ATP-binding protein
MSIDIRGISKRFGSFNALDRVDLTVEHGELLALLGPSGSGKTTLLRIIAGLEFAEEGSIRLNGEDAIGQKPRDRLVGFVFQHYALFRHMSVFENIAFGLRVRPRRERLPQAEIAKRVTHLLEMVQLGPLAQRYPGQLSGGQRQRVALARALAIEPKVLLLDEPFGALDAKVRQELRRWLRRLHSQIHVTSVFVTHDQEEALELADRVVVMNEGRIEQDGTPEAIVEHPATPFVLTFVGNVNIFHGRVQAGRATLGPLALDYPAHVSGEPRNAVGYTRPHELELSVTDTGDGLWTIVRDVRLAGALVKIELVDAGDSVIQVELGRQQYESLRLPVGAHAYVKPKRMRVFTSD